MHPHSHEEGQEAASERIYMKYMVTYTQHFMGEEKKIRNFYHAIDMFVEMNLLLMYKAYLSPSKRKEPFLNWFSCFSPFCSTFFLTRIFDT